MNRRGAAAIAAAIAAAGCAFVGRGRGTGDDAGPTDARIVLYRDLALVEEDVEAEVRDHRVELPLPAGVAAHDLTITSDDVRVLAWSAPAADGQRDIAAVTGDATRRGRLLGFDEHGVVLLDGADLHVVRGAEVLAGAVRPAVIAEIEGAAGRARFHLRYPTDRLTWQASYTLVDHHGKARLRGALGVDNQTGRRWRRAALAVVDDAAPDLGGGATDLPRVSRLPGRYTIEPGPQRLELALRDHPLTVRSTLVYDPVGAELEHKTQPPERDPAYGMKAWPGSLDETVKIDLASIADDPLPAGPVRLASVEADGALRWRGEGELLPPAADTASYLTVAVGGVDDVTGARARSDFVIDDGRQRMYEEIRVTLASTRPSPVDVMVREHLYRGPCWLLAYHSTGDRVEKEGAQQIALTTTVGPGGTATVVYRVVYHWSEAACTAPSSSKS